MNAEAATGLTAYARRWALRATALLAIALGACGESGSEEAGDPSPEAPRTGTPVPVNEMEIPPMRFWSPVISGGTTLSPRYTCDGANVPPVLHWSGAPLSTQMYALLMTTEDGGRVHWAVLLDGRATDVTPPEIPGTQLINSFGAAGYSGPCPADGTGGRFRFSIFALASRLSADEVGSGEELLKALPPPLAGATLSAKYE